MIRYLFDTDTASFLMKQYNPKLTHRFNQLTKEDWAISAITYGELLFGLEPLPPFHSARVRVATFADTANVLDWPTHAAVPYAEIRHRTRKQPLNDRDIFIAAHAIAIDATLVTNNTRHFTRMGSGLSFENWLG
jgi:tRNA(fMet)-specific endonuclease VapC